MNEVHYITNKRKTVKNEWGNDHSDFFSLYKKISTILFTYSLTCLNKDTSVLLKIVNI